MPKLITNAPKGSHNSNCWFLILSVHTDKIIITKERDNHSQDKQTQEGKLV